MALAAVALPALGEERLARDEFSLRIGSETHLLLFQNALVPAPGGALVRSNPTAPGVEYVRFQAVGLDSPLGRDTGDVELSLWAGLELGEAGSRDRLQGDVQTASVTLRSVQPARRAWLRLGRQVEAGGAARFARFDGLSAGIAILPELMVAIYGGFAVLPRWDQRPGYFHLGSAATSLLREPEAFEQPAREAYGLVGGKLSYDSGPFHASLSAHEQREGGEMGRRNLGLDAGVRLRDRGYLGGTLLFDLDALEPSTARAFADYGVTRFLDLGLEFLKAEPALLLSRQSVLSVFATSGYQELGGTFSLRPLSSVRVVGSGYAQFYSETLPGARLSLSVRVATSDGPAAGAFLFGYTRVDAVDLGYHSGRIAASHPLARKLTATVQGFVYLYDRAIEGYKTSLTGSLSLAYPFARQWELLWSGAASRSPYAALDASTQLRLTYQFTLARGGTAW